MWLPEQEYGLWPRQAPPPSTSPSPTPSTPPSIPAAPDPNQPASVSQGGIIAAGAVGGLAVVFLVSYLVLRWLRQRHADPKYIPTQFLKNKWSGWSPNTLRLKYLPSLQRRGSSQEMQTASTSNQTARRTRQRNNNGVDRDTAVDRHTSVRSVITLPPYSVDVGENERILGREGEREGIDTVVEFPETEMEMEERREEEMQSLYEIRQVRREERTARNDRRRRRQEAIATNDTEALDQLRRERRERNAATNNTTSQDLITEHEHRERRERLAEVEYADLGLARPDGSRIRANSNESSRPLLGAASRPGHNRQPSGGPYTQHQANQSVSSLRFAMTPDISDDEGESSGVTRMRTRSRGDSAGDYSIRSHRPWPLGNDFSNSRVTLATMRTQDTLETVESGPSQTSTTGAGSAPEQPSEEAPPPEYETIDLDASPNPSRTSLPTIRTAVPDEDAPPYSSPTHTLPGLSPIQPPPTTATSTSSGESMHTPRSTVTPHSSGHELDDSPPQLPELNVPSIEITPNTPVIGGSGRPTSSGGSGAQ